MSNPATSVLGETNRDKALRGEPVAVSLARLKEMQRLVTQCEGVGVAEYHWHFAAVINELLARREGKL